MTGTKQKTNTMNKHYLKARVRLLRYNIFILSNSMP